MPAGDGRRVKRREKDDVCIPSTQVRDSGPAKDCGLGELAEEDWAVQDELEEGERRSEVHEP